MKYAQRKGFLPAFFVAFAMLLWLLPAPGFSANAEPLTSSHPKSSPILNLPNSTEADEAIVLLLQFNATDATCGEANGSVSVGVSGGVEPYTYAWSNGATTQVITNLAAGQYTVTVTDAIGEMETGTVTIINIAGVFISISSTDATCGNADGNAITAVTGGVPPYSYVWSTGATTDAIIGLPAGTYTVTVTDFNGCTASNSVSIYGVGNGGPTVDAGSDQIICAGENATLTATATGGIAPYFYSWSDGLGSGATRTVAPIATTTFSVTAIDANGCVGVDDVTITTLPTPNVVIQPSQELCAGDDIILTAVAPGNLTYLWSTGSTTPSINNLAPGTYCVTVTNEQGCSNSNCFTLNIAPPILISIQELSEPCDSSATLIPAISGGVPPYSYLWTGSIGFPVTTQNIVVEQNGVYNLTVVDNNGCTATQSYTVDLNWVTANISGSTLLDCITNTTLLSAQGSSTGADISYTWYLPDGNTVAGPELLATLPGNYTLQVDNSATGCQAQVNATVFSLGDIADLEWGIHESLTACNSYRLTPITPPNIFIPMSFLWTLPDGSTSTDVAISSTASGVYQLQINVGTQGCTLHFSTFLALDDVCATLQGRVVFDESEDCIADAGEPGLGEVVLSLESGTATFFALSQADGSYEFQVPLDNYALSVNAPSPAWVTCADSYPVALTEAGSQATLDVPIIANAACPELGLQLTAPILRRCFQSTLYLRLTNLGAETVQAPEVALTLDPFLLYQNASVTPSAIDGQNLYWQLPPLAPGQTTTVYVYVIVSCNAVLGQVHCSEAQASAGPDCLGNWPGASLALNAVCSDGSVRFEVENTGAADLDESVRFIVIEDGVMMMQSSGTIEELASGQSLEYPFAANGSTWTFILDQAAGHPFSQRISRSVEGCGTNGQGGFTTGFVTQYAQQTNSPANAVLCQPNTGSYDPNDKAALPEGYGVQHYIEPENELAYRIRFQNTGTDTAFTVVVVDTLSNGLDINTLQLGNASHPYTASIEGRRTLVFRFDNILLPDSTTNLEASQGFVEFNIRPSLDAPLETRIDNTAAIYFDFNEPIITNAVYHTLGRNFWLVSNWQDIAGDGLHWRIFPNPSSQYITIDCDAFQGTATLVLVNAQGSVQEKFNLQSTKNELYLGHLPQGWYGFKIIASDGRLLGTGNLIRQ